MQKQNNTFIVPAKFIALNSSILGYLAKDHFSSDAVKRKDAENFLKCLADNALLIHLIVTIPPSTSSYDPRHPAPYYNYPNQY
jgi:hypothetical protein